MPEDRAQAREKDVREEEEQGVEEEEEQEMN